MSETEVFIRHVKAFFVQDMTPRFLMRVPILANILRRRRKVTSSNVRCFTARIQPYERTRPPLFTASSLNRAHRYHFDVTVPFGPSRTRSPARPAARPFAGTSVAAITMMPALKFAKDEAPARQRPSGTISAAQARVEALREKYGDADSASTTPSSSSSPSSPTVSDPPNPPATVLPPSASSPTANLKNTTTETAAAEGSGAESWRTAFNAIDNNDSNDVDDGDDAAAKDALFGGTRKGQTMSSPAGVFPDITGATVATIEGDSLARSSSRGDAPEGLVEAGDTVDLGLGDLEASLEAPGEDDDDLDAMIEAARKEAEALGLGGGEGEGEQHDHSDEEDLDLT